VTTGESALRRMLALQSASRSCIGLIASAIITLQAVSPALAEYRVGIGDVIEIFVSGAPDLRQKSAVNLDGDVSIPLAGRIHAADLSIPELRTRVRELLSTKVYRRITMDGRENETAIKPAEISLEIAEYKPVYLTGDVAKPGEMTYRPGLTVRQSVALAGGYDLMHIRMENPFLESADFKAEYDKLRTDLLKRQAQIIRIQAELNGSVESGRNHLSALPANSPIAAQVVKNEADQLAAEEADFNNEKAHLRALQQQIDVQFATLEKQYAEEKEGSKYDVENLQALEQLFQRSVIPKPRYTEERRIALLSSTRVLQTMASVAQVKRDRAEISRRLQRLDDQRRLDLMRQLQDAEMALSAVRSRLEAVGEKLLYTGTIKSQLTRGPGGKPEIVVFRRNSNGTERIGATEDTELSPGDVVEVALHLDYQVAAALQVRP
jgi:polysaccharide biosynthesis/export protein